MLYFSQLFGDYLSDGRCCDNTAKRWMVRYFAWQKSLFDSTRRSRAYTAKR